MSADRQVDTFIYFHRLSPRTVLTISESGQNGIQNLIEALTCVFRQESRHKISMLPKQGVLPPVSPICFSIRQMLRAIQFDDDAGFAQGGKSSAGDARCRYVLQLSVAGPQGTLFPLMREEMDMRHPETGQEDCELQSFARLSQRLKKEFPKLPLCLVAGALYCCQAVVAACQLYDWKYVLTLKEGRQPATWEETIRLLPLHPANRPRCRLGQDGQEGPRDSRWVGNVLLGEHQTRVILRGEITSEPSATLYANFTNFSNLTPQRVAVVVNRAGRERRLIEDAFHTQKNHGIGLEHVFAPVPPPPEITTARTIQRLDKNRQKHG